MRHLGYPIGTWSEPSFAELAEYIVRVLEGDVIRFTVRIVRLSLNYRIGTLTLLMLLMKFS